VTCRDLAVMAVTLASGGVNPVTQRRVLQPPNTGRLLSIMSSCGMCDHAGEWIYNVGMPAKSGEAGGILAASVLRRGPKADQRSFIEPPDWPVSRHSGLLPALATAHALEQTRPPSDVSVRICSAGWSRSPSTRRRCANRARMCRRWRNFSSTSSR
jgi:hypothetical protein